MRRHNVRLRFQRLARVERIAHRLADEDQFRLSMMAMTKKAGEPEPGTCRLSLPWASSSPSDGDPGGKPSLESRGEVRVLIGPFQDERHEGQRRHHRVGEEVLKDDARIVEAERPRRV